MKVKARALIHKSLIPSWNAYIDLQNTVSKSETSLKSN